jgi:hypothetical protein
MVMTQPFEHDEFQERADESVTLPYKPTPGLGPDPNRTKPYFTIEGRIPNKQRTNLAPNVLALKALVYGSCAGIVLCCLIWVIWVYSQ